MKIYDAVIIGGGPGGLTAAIAARKSYPDKSILLIRKDTIALIPCGIPYMFHALAKPEDDIIPDAALAKNNIDLVVDEAVDVQEHTIRLKTGEPVEFNKLVLSTGSYPFVPPIAGIDKDGVFFVKKDLDYLKAFKNRVVHAGQIVIVGGGFIGVELADELLNEGKKLTIIENMPGLLSLSFDEEFSNHIQQLIEDKGAQVILGKSVKEISGGAQATGVILEDGSKAPADLVVVSVGYRPQTELALQMGLEVDKRNGIVVDEYLRTSQKDVFAIGDCTAKRDFLTGDDSKLMLASTATAQARIAGMNLFSVKVIKDFTGTLGTFATSICDTAFGVTGLTEKQALALGIDYVVGRSETMDRHPGRMPGASQTVVKMIYSRYSHLLLGAQMSGGESVGEWVNMMSVIIQKKMTDMEIDILQIGTHPKLTPSPVAYPLMNAAVNAIIKEYQTK